jgi:hypothetical protein
MSSRASTSARYQLGPLERRGVWGQLRNGQLALAVTTVASVLAAVMVYRSAVGLLVAGILAATGTVLVFLPMHHNRGIDELAPAAFRYLRRRATGRDRYKSSAPDAGFLLGGPPPPAEFPPEVGRVEFLSTPYGRDLLGVLADREARTYLAVIECKANSFVLLDEGDKVARLAGFAEVTKSLARERSPIRRLQIMEMVVPGDPEALQQYLDTHQDPGAPAEATASYRELIRAPRQAVRGEHRVYVVAALDPARASRAIRNYGGRGRDLDLGACTVLAREVRGLIRRLEAANIEVRQALAPRPLAALIALAYDPNRRSKVARRIHIAPEFEGVAPHAAGPGRTGPERSDYYAHAGVVSATYWVAEWPREPVQAEFLAPLLVTSNVLRTFSLVFEAVPPAKAMRQANFAKTSDVTDEAMRQRLGFLSTAKARNQRTAVERREQELADGHTDVRYTAWVTVTGGDLEDLEVCQEEIEEQASQCRLELQLAVCEQAQAFTYGALPLARGLKKAGALT